MNPDALELLAPAKNAEIGIEAIRHGADAVYIGGPDFGARQGAGNSLAEIARLAEFAHRFHARVFLALNTILRDDELEPARQLAWQAHDAGVDALIIQDLGLLELDLPPLPLHASTQTDIRDAAKARFLADVGFSQIVLARELSLADIARIDAAMKLGAGEAPPVLLEYFVHGALCVAYSGQCYISHAHTGRSANRGECSQACRLPYTLEDGQGRILAHDKHLLSMKDNDQSANLRALADAGIRSFKIEGRLKDMAYVKNVTAHYRQLLDALLDAAPQYARASSGRSRHFFAPRPEKTFNRGATDYFAHGRQRDIGAFDTPKFAGEPIGEITALGDDWLEVSGDTALTNGDGFSYLAGGKRLAGLRANRVVGRRLYPDEMPRDLRLGMPLARNHDHAYARQLEKASAERRIGVSLTLSDDAAGFVLSLRDEDGYLGEASLAQEKSLATQPHKSLAALAESLGQVGTTDFAAQEVNIRFAQPWFLTVSAAKGLRRAAVAALVAARAAARPRDTRRTASIPPASYPESELSYLGNVLNQAARAFYQRHGVGLIADAYEADTTPGEVSLMITKHCLRHAYHLCPKEAKGQVAGIKAEPMTLVNGKERLTLRFDCKACEMHVIGRLKKHRAILLVPAR